MCPAEAGKDGRRQLTTMEAQITGRDVRFAGAGGLLTGTLQLPPEGTEPRAAVVFLHGSGPQDRNENNPRAPLNIFNTLAADLAAAGIASLRYDKRGVGESTGDGLTASLDDLAADAREAVRFLRRAYETKELPVFAVGHSEGATLALLLAAGEQPPAGAILLCPTITPMPALLRRQAAGVQGAIEHLSSEQRQAAGIPPGFDQRRATEEMIAAIGAAPGDQPVITFMQQPVPARWFRSHFALDHAALLSSVRCPVLSIGGAKDTQMPPQDADAVAVRLRAAGVEAQGLIIPDLTHILRRTDGDGGLQDYAAQVRQPVDAELRATLIRWVQAHLPEDGLSEEPAPVAP